MLEFDTTKKKVRISFTILEIDCDIQSRGTYRQTLQCLCAS